MVINLTEQIQTLKLNAIALPLGILSGSTLTIAPSVISNALEKNPLTHDPLYKTIGPRTEKRLGSTFLGSLGCLLLNGAKILGSINGILVAKKIIEKPQQEPLSILYLGTQCLAMATHFLGSRLVLREKKAIYDEQKKKYLKKYMQEKNSLQRTIERMYQAYLCERKERKEQLKK